MRVLHVTPSPDLRNGISDYATTFGDAMGRYGGVEVERLFFPENRLMSREFKDQLSNVDTSAFDLVHGEIGVGTNSVFYALSHLMSRRATRFVVTLHDPPLVLFSSTLNLFGYRTKGWLNKALRKLVADPVFDRLVLPRRMTRLRNIVVLNRGAVNPTRRRFPECSVTYAPHIAGEGRRVVRPDACTDVLFYGYIARAKGVELAIRAVASLRARGINLRLHIVGGCLDAHYQKALMELVRQEASDVPIEWHGFVDDAELGALFDCCCLVMMPYHETDTLSASGAVVRAMEHGLPVILSDTLRFKGEYADGEDVLMFRSGDALALADKIQSLVTDRAMRQRMSDRSIRRIETVHSPARVIHQFVDVYRQALASHPR